MDEHVPLAIRELLRKRYRVEAVAARVVCAPRASPTRLLSAEESDLGSGQDLVTRSAERRLRHTDRNRCRVRYHPNVGDAFATTFGREERGADLGIGE